MPACRNCGEDNPQRFRFCGSCGTLLPTDPAASREIRKVVSVVFTDVTGSTSLGERLDPESLRRVMGLYFEAMRSVLERHGGAVQKFIGDAVMAVFGIPQLHEDDAVRAVRAAAEMREALRDLNEDLQRDWGVSLRTRTGVNTGEVVVAEPSGNEALVIGDAVNVAARLEQVASPGEILIGMATYRLVRDAITAQPVEPLILKGKGEAVPAFRLTAVAPDAAGTARRLDSPLVGREDEYFLLTRAFQRAARDRSCHLFTLFGEAGVGKTRLAAEVVSSVAEEATALQGRCLPYGESITFSPVAEVVRQATGTSESSPADEIATKIAGLVEGEEDAPLVAERVAQVLGLSHATAAQEELFWGVRKFLEALARRRPLVVVFDDVHWGEPAFLDLVEHVATWSLDAPILLLCVARPELLDRRQSWGGGKPNAVSILLEPLSEEQSAVLLDNLLGKTQLEEAARYRITEAAEGNPLFLEELLRMLIDDGLLRREDGRWVPTTRVSTISVPATIHTLLSARLDRLEAEERDVIGRASVAGKVFYRNAVQHLAPERARPGVPAHLMALVRKELIRPERSGFPGDEAFRFRHILIRDAAYNALPKEARGSLHERFAEWLEQASRERTSDYDEILGYHLEHAFRYRTELGPAGWRDRALALRAAGRLATAGRRAFARGDIPAAVGLLSRAVSLLPETDPMRLSLLPDLAEAVAETGDLARAAVAVSQAVEETAASGDQRLHAHAVIVRLLFEQDTDPGGDAERAGREARQAIDVFQAAGDDRGLAKAWRLLSEIHWTACHFAAADEALKMAAEHARRAGEEREEAENLAVFALSGALGPTPTEDAVRRCEAVLDRAKGNLTVKARAFRALAAMKASQGSFQEARQLLGDSRKILEDLGLKLRAAFVSETAGFVEMLAGDAAMAARELRRGYEQLEAMRATPYVSTAAAFLAQALYATGDYEEAEHFTRVSEGMAGREDILTQVVWRGARAKLLARRGQEGALELAREAVRLAEGTDRLDMHGDALIDLAEALRLTGRGTEAAAVLEGALRLYERKRNVVATRKARAALQELAGATTAASG